MAVVRATEILLALIIDKLLFNARQTSVWHSIGAVLVLTGVSLMSCHMHIQGYYNTGWFNPEMHSRAVF